VIGSAFDNKGTTPIIVTKTMGRKCFTNIGGNL